MSDPQNDGYHEAVWPRAEMQQKGRTLARRLDTLEGKTIAFMWDYIFRGNEIFDVLEAELTRRYKGLRVIGWREFGNIHGGDERAIVAGLGARMKALGVDAAVTGMAC